MSSRTDRPWSYAAKSVTRPLFMPRPGWVLRRGPMLGIRHALPPARLSARIQRAVDQAHMTIGLRKIAQHAAGLRIKLLGEQPYIVAACEQTVKQRRAHRVRTEAAQLRLCGGFVLLRATIGAGIFGKTWLWPLAFFSSSSEQMRRRSRSFSPIRRFNPIQAQGFMVFVLTFGS